MQVLASDMRRVNYCLGGKHETERMFQSLYFKFMCAHSVLAYLLFFSSKALQTFPTKKKKKKKKKMRITNYTKKEM
jgi:hypothetical protein